MIGSSSAAQNAFPPYSRDYGYQRLCGSGGPSFIAQAASKAPAGSRRLHQQPIEIEATIKSGMVIMECGEHTGQLPTSCCALLLVYKFERGFD